MADRNRNFLNESIGDRNHAQRQPKSSLINNHHNQHQQQKIANHRVNNNLADGGGDDDDGGGGNEVLTTTTTSPATTTTTALPTRGLYAKKDNSNYQRFVDYPKDATSKEPKKELENKVTTGDPSGRDEKAVGSIGWRYGSPSSNSIEINECPKSNQEARPANDTSNNVERPSGTIGRDDEDTENLSGIADDEDGVVVPLAPIGLEKEDDDTIGQGNYYNSPIKLDSANLRERRINQEVGSANNNKNPMLRSSSDGQEGSRRTAATAPLERSQGILMRKQYSVPESSSVPGAALMAYERDRRIEMNEKDSIDGSDVMLEIYDDEDEEDNSENGIGRGSKKKKPKIPDGGWGWVVVFSSLVISMIADGVSFSFGLLYIEFLYEFEASKATTAWIGSLFMAVPLLSGPIMSALVDRYGCRKMTIAGGIISGTGFVLSSYARSIEVMYLTFGVLAGLGLGLCYVTAVVSIAFWFDKKRTLAVGLGACGTGIGTFVYAPMTTYFIQQYGWRGSVLLLAGTFFNMIVCGTVMRDPEWWIQEQRKQQGLLSPRKSQGGKSIDGGGGRSQSSPVDEEFPGIEEIRRLMKSGHAPEYLLQNLSTTTDSRSSPGGNPTFRSVVNLPTFVRQSEKVPL